MAQALALLAAAVLFWSPHRASAARLARLVGRGRRRFRWRPPLPLLAAVAVGVLVGALVHPLLGLVAAPLGWWATGRAAGAATKRVDDLELATTWDLLAACLRSGMPVPAAVRAVAGDLPDRPGAALRDAADLLSLGAAPAQAWASALACPPTSALARGACRTARSGAALAAVARSLAGRTRDKAVDAAEARAQRAAVLITAPLGLCFLPAFLCLGVVPLVIGLATDLMTTP